MTDLDRLIEKAKSIGVDLICFEARKGGKAAKQCAMERARLFWALHDEGWASTRIARAAGYDRNTVNHIMGLYVRPGHTRIESIRAAASLATMKVAKQNDIPPHNIWERNPWGSLYRTHKLARARREIWSQLREAGYSLPEIAEATGCHSHSSVLAATRTIRPPSARGREIPTACHLQPSSGCAARTA